VTEREILKLIAKIWIDIEDQPKISDIEIEDSEEKLDINTESNLSDDDYTDEEQSGVISPMQGQETIIQTYIEALKSIEIAVEYAKSKCDEAFLQKLESAKYSLQQSKMNEQKLQQVLTASKKNTEQIVIPLNCW